MMPMMPITVGHLVARSSAIGSPLDGGLIIGEPSGELHC
jgi:hypothetical protein